jgi:hypothetical protein
MKCDKLVWTGLQVPNTLAYENEVLLIQLQASFSRSVGAATLNIMTLSVMTYSIITLSVMTYSIMTLIIKGLFVTLSIKDTA